jgi:hypothetical protein
MIRKMIKKTGEVQTVAGTDNVVAVNNSIEPGHAIDNRKVPVEHPQLQEKINSIIHEWLTDMWLLTTGEESGILNPAKTHNGRPLAVVCDGQMRLTESKPATLEALRAVGIEMS